MRMNKAVRNAIHRRFLRMLDSGNFPEVGWNRNGCIEYDTYQYLQFWGRMVFMVDCNLKQLGYGLGCYELKRSDAFRQDVARAVMTITPQMIISSPGVLGIPA